MADSILRLKVDNQEYDSKLKRATEGLQRYVDGCRKAGGTLAVVEDETLQFVKALGEMDTLAKGGQQSLKEMTRSLTDLTIQYRSLTDDEKNSPFGQALAKGIDQLTERAAVAKDAMGDVNAAITRAASDTRAFDQIAGATSLVTSSFQTLQGTAKLLGIDLGDNVEVIARLQAAMSVTMGLTQMQNALQKESAVMQGVATLQTKANAAAQLLLAKNTAVATAAGEAFNVVARMNPYVLIASAVIAAGSALVMFARHSQKAAEAEKQQAEETDRLRKKMEDMQNAIGRHVGDVEAKYRALQHEWSRLTTVAEKTDFVNEQSKAFQDLGLNVTSVTDAEQALVDKAPEVIAALKAVAQAEAYSDLYKQAIQKRATEWENRVRGVDTGDDYIHEAVNPRKTWSVIPEEWTAAGLQRGDYESETIQMMNSQSTRFRLTKEGVDKINAYRAEQAAALNQKLEKQYNDEVQFYENKWTEAEDAVIATRSKIPAALQANGNTITGTTATEVTSEQIFKAGSLPALTQQLKDLRAAQLMALDNRDWANYQQQIEQVQHQIDALKGQWRDGLQATFTITASDEQVLSELSKIQDIEIHDKNVAVSLDDSEVMNKVRKVDDLTVEDKTMTITVNTAEAYNQVRNLTSDIEGTTVQFKVQPELSRGLSITTSAGLNAYISQIKQEIDQADLGSDLYNSLTSKLADATMLQNLVQESLSVGLGTALFDVADETGQDFWDRVLSPEGVANADWQGIADVINQKRKELGLEAITLDYDTGNTSRKSEKIDTLEQTQQLVSGMSQLNSGLQQIGIKLPDGVNKLLGGAQGIMSVINGAQTIMRALTLTFGTTQSTALSANTSATLALTAAIHANTIAQGASTVGDTAKTVMLVAASYAHGGTIPHAAHGYAVPGNHYSGDMTPIMANAGELVLNRAQQGNLASQLEGSPEESEQSSLPFVTGQVVFLGINNHLLSSGQGQIVTTKMLQRVGINI